MITLIDIFDSHRTRYEYAKLTFFSVRVQPARSVFTLIFHLLTTAVFYSMELISLMHTVFTISDVIVY